MAKELTSRLPGALGDGVILSPLNLVLTGNYMYTVAAVADDAVNHVLVCAERSGASGRDVRAELGDMQFVVDYIVGKVAQAIVAMAEGFEDAARGGSVTVMRQTC